MADAPAPNSNGTPTDAGESAALDASTKSQISAMLAATPPDDSEDMEPETSAAENTPKETPKEETPKADAPTENDDAKALRAEVEQLRAQIAAKNETPPDDEEGGEATDPEPLELVSQEEFDAVNTLEGMNALMNKVFQKARESVLKEIPTMVTQTAQRQADLTNTVEGFYRDNPELVDHRRYVGFVTNDLISKNPGKGLKELLPQIADRVRADLKIEKAAAKTEAKRQEEPKDETKKPAFAAAPRNGARGGSEAPELNDQQEQILKMIG